MAEHNFLTYTGGDLATNALLFPAPGGDILFDAPEGVASWLESIGRTPRLLLLTHTHFDHILDVAAVKEKFSCPVGFHIGCNNLERELELTRAFGLPGFDMFTADFLIEETWRESDADGAPAFISWLGQSFRTFHVPGHHPGSVCFLVGQENSDLLIGGDVLFAGGIGRWDLPGGNRQQLLDGIRAKLLPLPDDTLVFPGHGPMTTIGHERRTNGFLA